jgi:hypothetical protein
MPPAPYYFKCKAIWMKSDLNLKGNVIAKPDVVAHAVIQVLGGWQI